MIYQASESNLGFKLLLCFVVSQQHKMIFLLTAVTLVTVTFADTEECTNDQKRMIYQAMADITSCDDLASEDFWANSKYDCNLDGYEVTPNGGQKFGTAKKDQCDKDGLANFKKEMQAEADGVGKSSARAVSVGAVALASGVFAALL